MVTIQPQSPTGSDTAHRGRFDATVERNELICREHYQLRLRIAGDFPPTEPGQFIQLGCHRLHPPAHEDAESPHQITKPPNRQTTKCKTPLPRFQPTDPDLLHPTALLRRPFSLAGRGDDERGTWIDIVHRAIGVGTHWLAGLRVGERVDLIGPLGNAFTLPAGKSIGLLVGGGVGLPPMFYLAEALRRAGWSAVAFVGALSRDLLAVTLDAEHVADAQGAPVRCAAEFARHGYATVVTTDDGTFGLRGRITAGLERYLQQQSPADAARTVVFTCGPEPMMHAVATLARKHGLDCQVCLEQAMACGMGTCQSCVVKIDPSHVPPGGKPLPPHGTTETGRPWRFRLACTDGPVFPAETVIWQGGLAAGV